MDQDASSASGASGQVKASELAVRLDETRTEVAPSVGAKMVPLHPRDIDRNG